MNKDEYYLHFMIRDVRHVGRGDKWMSIIFQEYINRYQELDNEYMREMVIKMCNYCDNYENENHIKVHFKIFAFNEKWFTDAPVGIWSDYEREAGFNSSHTLKDNLCRNVFDIHPRLKHLEPKPSEIIGAIDPVLYYVYDYDPINDLMKLKIIDRKRQR